MILTCTLYYSEHLKIKRVSTMVKTASSFRYVVNVLSTQKVSTHTNFVRLIEPRKEVNMEDQKLVWGKYGRICVLHMRNTKKINILRDSQQTLIGTMSLLLTLIIGNGADGMAQRVTDFLL